MNSNAHLLRHAAALSAMLALTACSKDAAPQNASTPDRHHVERGTMLIQVTSNAEIKAGKETLIRSEVEGQNTVIFLVPEGKEVKDGEKLVELDASGLIERKAKQEIDYARAEATKVQAEKDYEIQLKQFDADKIDSENKLKIARLELEKFLGRPKDTDSEALMGEREQKTIAAETDIGLAKAKLEVAKDKYEWSKKLNEKDFVTKNELENDRLSKESAEAALVLSINKRDLLVNYENQKSRLELEQKARDAALEVERVKAKGEAKLAQALAEKKSRNAEYELAKDRFENLVKQVKNCVIKSPGPGIVVFAQVDSRGGMRSEYISEGSTVRERQSLLVLPDTTRMVCSLKIHEAEIEKVRSGMSALIKVESIGKTFNGFVRKVAPLPDSSSRWSNPDLKVFQAEVEIDVDSPGLKPGTSAEVAILVAEIKDTIKVPIQAVQRDRMVQYVWLDTTPRPKAVPVELGLSDRNFVEVKKGLDAGAMVLLTAPSGEEPPKFDQPKAEGTGAAKAHSSVADASVKDPAAGTGSRPTDAAAGGDQPRRGRNGQGGQANPQAMAAVTEFVELLKQKHPELASKFEGGGMGMMRAFQDEEVKKAIDEDPELKEKRDAMMTQMRGMGGGRRGQGGQGGNRQGGQGNGEAPRDGK